MSCETTKRKRSRCWSTIKKSGLRQKFEGPVLSRIYAPECVLGSVQTRYTGRKTVRNDTKKAAGLHRKGGLSTSNNNYHRFLLFAKSVLNGHRMLRSVTFLPSSTFASPSAFLYDFTHCGVWGHHVWWVQGLLLWRRRSHAEYIIPAISLENSREMPLTGNGSRQVRLSRAVFQDWGDCAPMMVFPQRPARGDKLLWGFLHVRQHRINCNLWLQPITLWLPRQTFTYTVYISISYK